MSYCAWPCSVGSMAMWPAWPDAIVPVQPAACDSTMTKAKSP